MIVKTGVEINRREAQAMLRRNSENNRKPKSSRILGYATDMAAGRWRYPTGETLKFDVDGNLIDGQNRLTAILLATETKPDLTVTFDVVYDLPADAMQVLDSGASRTFGDTLAISGTPDRNRVGAVVRWIVMWERNFYRGTGGGYAPTNAELTARYHQTPGAFDTAGHRSSDTNRAGLGPSSPAGTAFYLFHRRDPEACHAFFDMVISGANLPPLHPALTLRNKLVRSSADRMTRAEVLAAYIRAWNGYREGRTMAQIIVSTSGKLTNANFPKPVN